MKKQSTQHGPRIIPLAKDKDWKQTVKERAAARSGSHTPRTHATTLSSTRSSPAPLEGMDSSMNVNVNLTMPDRVTEHVDTAVINAENKKQKEHDHDDLQKKAVDALLRGILYALFL